MLSQQITTIVGALIALLIAILMLRLRHFDKEIENLQQGADVWSNDIKTDLTKEIKKRNPDIEVVINIVNSLSSADGIRKRLSFLSKSYTRGFYADFVAIGILVLIGVMSFANVTSDTLIGVSFIAGLVVFADIYVFIINYREFVDLKNKIKARRTA